MHVGHTLCEWAPRVILPLLLKGSSPLVQRLLEELESPVSPFGRLVKIEARKKVERKLW